MIAAALWLLVFGVGASHSHTPAPEPLVVLQWPGAAGNEIPDVFSARFLSAVRRASAAAAAAAKAPRRFRGYVLDESDRWSLRDGPSLLERFRALPQDTPGHQRAEAFLDEQGDPDATLNERETERFAEMVAREYFGTWRRAVRNADPRYPTVDVRFTSPPPGAVLRGVKAAMQPPNRAAGR